MINDMIYDIIYHMIYVMTYMTYEIIDVYSLAFEVAVGQQKS